MDDLRIPKVAADISCHTIHGEKLTGQIFLDIVSATGYTLPQILEFFNSPQPFFPLRIPQGTSILIHKQMILRVDLPGLLRDYESEISSSLDLRRDATLHCTNSTSLRGQFIIDMPQEHARSLDLLNDNRRFIPFLLEESLTLIHTIHIYKVEES